MIDINIPKQNDEDYDSIDFINIFNNSKNKFNYLFTVQVNCDLTLKFIKITNGRDYDSIKDADLLVILISAGGNTIVSAKEFVKCLFEIHEVNKSGEVDNKYIELFKNDSHYMGELFMLYGLAKKDVSTNGVNEFGFDLKVHSLMASTPIKMMFDKGWVHISAEDLDRVCRTMEHLDLIAANICQKNYDPFYARSDNDEDDTVFTVFFLEEDLIEHYPIEVIGTVFRYPSFDDECGFEKDGHYQQFASYYLKDDVEGLMQRKFCTCNYHS